jgi:methionyl-tRNA synthetase
MDKQAFHIALERINKVVRHGNRYVEDNAPWALAKAGSTVRLNTVLYHLIETLRLVALQLAPFMPVKMEMMLGQIHGEDVSKNVLSYAQHSGWGLLRPGHRCSRPTPIFPRME